MPNKPLSDLHRAKRGVAILAACLVHTINQSDPSFQKRFLKNLEEAYSKIREGEWEGDVSEEMTLLSWTREFLTGYDNVSGQGTPFFED